MATMAKYWLYSPRGFSNEYIIVKTNSREEEERLREWFESRHDENAEIWRVTTQDIRDLIRNEKLRRKLDPAFSGYCTPWKQMSVDGFLSLVC